MTAGPALLNAPVCVAGAAPAKRARYGSRLTAANYRYIVRGRSEKAAADDVHIAAQCRARLAPYDRDLRQFRRGSNCSRSNRLLFQAWLAGTVPCITVAAACATGCVETDCVRMCLPLYSLGTRGPARYRSWP